MRFHPTFIKHHNTSSIKIASNNIKKGARSISASFKNSLPHLRCFAHGFAWPWGFAPKLLWLRRRQGFEGPKDLGDSDRRGRNKLLLEIPGRFTKASNAHFSIKEASKYTSNKNMNKLKMIKVCISQL